MGAQTSTICWEMPAVGAGQPQPCGEEGPGPNMKKSTLKRHGKYVNCKNKVGDALVTPGSPADTMLKDTGDSRYVIPFTRDIYTLSHWITAITGERRDPSWDTIYMLQCLAEFQVIAKHHQPPEVKDHSNKTPTAETPTTLSTAPVPYAPQYHKLSLSAPEPDPLLHEVTTFVTMQPARSSQQDTAAAGQPDSLLLPNPDNNIRLTCSTATALKNQGTEC
ncbi:hypothetical protein chiPu_0004823 [Chiloscyllium punctatum]|uniref:Uncharacterized protein n=1 Tax=Chiloscyllium punctatum TaxID=137246 RepID=A0A401S7N8_CHIPU|nr:hypothetical protein [Chiloscyllium punctatum]